MAEPEPVNRDISVLHRRPAYGVNAPALLRHVCFRVKDPAQTDSLDVAAAKRMKSALEANTALMTIQLICDAPVIYVFELEGTDPRTCAGVLNRDDRDNFQAAIEKYEAKQQEAAARNKSLHPLKTSQTLLNTLPKLPDELSEWRVRICMDMHGEYYSVTLILDQIESKAKRTASSMPMTGAGPDGPLTNDAVLQPATCSAALLRSIEEDMSSMRARSRPTPVDYSSFIQCWYRRVWDLLDRHFGALETLFLGEVFAQFRGLAMERTSAGFPASSPSRAAGVAPDDGPALEGEPAADAVVTDTVLPRPDVNAEPHGTFAPRHDPISGGPYTQYELTFRRRALCEWLNDNREFVRGVLQLDPSVRQRDPHSYRNDEDANCVLCMVLGGGAIYGSSLGRSSQSAAAVPNAKGDQTATTTIPLQYLVVYDSWSKFLLGRLLRRMHSLGELRSAALLDLPMLSRASDRIRALGTEIDGNLRTSDPAHDSALLERKDLRLAQAKLNEIGSSDIPGGLLYRINHSRAYTQSFEQQMSDMGFERIEGWEPYDAFMHRNLFKTLGYIDGIGRRYEGLASRVQRLTAARNLEEQMNVSRRILHIQRLGEIIGGAAFAYYFGQLLGKSLELLHKGICDPPVACLGWLCWLTPNNIATEVIGIILAGVIFGLAWRYFNRRWEQETQNM